MLPESSFPLQHLDRTILGLSHDVSDATFSKALQDHLTTQRWHVVGEDWPTPGSYVDVVVHEMGGSKPCFVRDMMFIEAGLSGSWDLPLEDLEEQVFVDLRRTRNLERLKGGVCAFQMSGGDWEATFPGPLFGRKGMGYSVHPKDSWYVITHWREQAPAPHFLTAPTWLSSDWLKP